MGWRWIRAILSGANRRGAYGFVTSLNAGITLQEVFVFSGEKQGAIQEGAVKDRIQSHTVLSLSGKSSNYASPSSPVCGLFGLLGAIKTEAAI